MNSVTPAGQEVRKATIEVEGREIKLQITYVFLKIC